MNTIHHPGYQEARALTALEKAKYKERQSCHVFSTLFSCYPKRGGSMSPARKQRKHAIDELTEFTAITHRWRNQSHGTISQSKQQARLGIQTIPNLRIQTRKHILAITLLNKRQTICNRFNRSLNRLLHFLNIHHSSFPVVGEPSTSHATGKESTTEAVQQ